MKRERKTKKWYPGLKSLLFYLVILGCMIPVWANGNGEPQEPVIGRFKHTCIMVRDNQPVVLTDSKITREMLKNEIILYYMPISHAYIYLYALNPGKEFRLIRPVYFNVFERTGNYFYNPECITFTDTCYPGTGTDPWEIHLVISTKRLPAVEKLISDLGKIEQGETDRLTELNNKLNREIKNLKLKKILGYDIVELPVSVNNPFRKNEDIEAWCNKNTEMVNFTVIYERVYYLWPENKTEK
jgi:hypothetical protein